MAQKINPRFIILLILLLILLLQWFLPTQNKQDEGSRHMLKVHEHSAAKIETTELQEIPLLPKDSQSQINALTPPATDQSHPPESKLSELSQWLPDWLREDGSLLQDSRVIDGHTILRSRGRIEWDADKYLEIEITDVGIDADEDLLKSLGFDLLLENSETENGFTMTQDEDGYLVNQDYDLEDQTGSLQLLVEGRYLIEIQVEQLPEAAFQEVLDIDIPFEAIFKQLDAN
ncbi:MAG: hypothetical protein ACSHX8_12155 [Opitutaceae bacterium]